LTFEEIFQQLTHWLKNFSIQYGYFGVFLASLLGSVSIFFPVPYTLILFTLGSIESFNPVMLSVASGLGSGLGEFSGYLLGLSGRRIISDKNKRKMDYLLKLFGRFWPFAIFLFALTPLPDDLIFIPLGVMQYSLLKAIMPALIGKFCMSLIIVYSARFTVHIAREIFGVEGEGFSALISMVVASVLLVIIFIVMFKVDWEKIFEKRSAKKEEVEKFEGDC